MDQRTIPDLLREGPISDEDARTLVKFLQGHDGVNFNPYWRLQRTNDFATMIHLFAYEATLRALAHPLELQFENNETAPMPREQQLQLSAYQRFMECAERLEDYYEGKMEVDPTQNLDGTSGISDQFVRRYNVLLHAYRSNTKPTETLQEIAEMCRVELLRLNQKVETLEEQVEENGEDYTKYVASHAEYRSMALLADVMGTMFGFWVAKEQELLKGLISTDPLFEKYIPRYDQGNEADKAILLSLYITRKSIEIYRTNDEENTKRWDHLNAAKQLLGLFNKPDRYADPRYPTHFYRGLAKVYDAWRRVDSEITDNGDDYIELSPDSLQYIIEELQQEYAKEQYHQEWVVDDATDSVTQYYNNKFNEGIQALMSSLQTVIIQHLQQQLEDLPDLEEGGTSTGSEADEAGTSTGSEAGEPELLHPESDRENKKEENEPPNGDALSDWGDSSYGEDDSLDILSPEAHRIQQHTKEAMEFIRQALLQITERIERLEHDIEYQTTEI